MLHWAQPSEGCRAKYKCSGKIQSLVIANHNLGATTPGTGIKMTPEFEREFA